MIIFVKINCPNQGSKYRISGSYRIGVFHIGYRISE